MKLTNFNQMELQKEIAKFLLLKIVEANAENEDTCTISLTDSSPFFEIFKKYKNDDEKSISFIESICENDVLLDEVWHTIEHGTLLNVPVIIMPIEVYDEDDSELILNFEFEFETEYKDDSDDFEDEDLEDELDDELNEITDVDFEEDPIPQKKTLNKKEPDEEELDEEELDED